MRGPDGGGERKCKLIFLSPVGVFIAAYISATSPEMSSVFKTWSAKRLFPAVLSA